MLRHILRIGSFAPPGMGVKDDCVIPVYDDIDDIGKAEAFLKRLRTVDVSEDKHGNHRKQYELEALHGIFRL